MAFFFGPVKKKKSKYVIVVLYETKEDMVRSSVSFWNFWEPAKKREKLPSPCDGKRSFHSPNVVMNVIEGFTFLLDTAHDGLLTVWMCQRKLFVGQVKSCDLIGCTKLQVLSDFTGVVALCNREYIIVIPFVKIK
jgi:hypothetical protein